MSAPAWSQQGEGGDSARNVPPKALCAVTTMIPKREQHKHVWTDSLATKFLTHRIADTIQKLSLFYLLYPFYVFQELSF